jgi:hypothetical protein
MRLRPHCPAPFKEVFMTHNGTLSDINIDWKKDIEVLWL